MDDVTVITCCGEEIHPYLDAAARLRIEVFREYPYLYDGTACYESEYLRNYARSRDSVFVCALVGGEVVGVSTALPLKDADDSFRDPFREADVAVEDFYYLGESVLLPAYRGRGIGHAFFDHREHRARELGFRSTTFCSVLRPAQHPLCPPGYRDHKKFWSGRGYHPTGLVAALPWQQIDAEEEVMNRLEFWVRGATTALRSAR